MFLSFDFLSHWMTYCIKHVLYYPSNRQCVASVNIIHVYDYQWINKQKIQWLPKHSLLYGYMCVCTKSECESINVSFRSSRHYLMSAAVWWFPHCETQRQASPMRYFQLVGWYTPEALQWLMQSVRAVPWPVGYITGCQQVTLTDGFLSSNVF